MGMGRPQGSDSVVWKTLSMQIANAKPPLVVNLMVKVKRNGADTCVCFDERHPSLYEPLRTASVCQGTTYLLDLAL